jgi:flagellar motor switch protein FliN/FliY
MMSRIPVAEAAAVIARALEDLLGHDVVLTTGPAALGHPDDDALPEGTTRAIVLPFSDGVVGEVTLVISEPFATAMEAATADASLTTAAVPALDAGAGAIAMIVDIGTSVEHAGEIAPDTLLASVTGEFAAVPILENDVRVACVVIRIVDDIIGREEPAPHVTPIPAASVAPLTPAPTTRPYDDADSDADSDADPDDEPARGEVFEPTYDEPIATPALAAGADRASVALARHEFQPLADGPGPAGPARPLSLLNDVDMEVTAELGRRRLKVRDIVALRPGSVVELDRAAGSPVDVLVNGALVWHGEVVIVDDEFGIRVAEIVVDES